MLKVMRKHAKYFYFLFVIVIVSFLFWGVGTDDQYSVPPVAEVGKDRIGTEEYWRAYQNAERIYRNIYQERFAEIEESLNLKENVLKTLVEEKLLLHAAYELGLAVTDEELNESITNDPMFQRDGAFNKDIYLNVLRLNRLNAQIFEEDKRKDLLLLKMRRLIWDSVVLAPSDLRGLRGDEKTVEALKDVVLQDMRNKALESYVGGLKKRIKVVAYTDRI